MPIYEVKCASCGEEEERLVRSHRDPLAGCSGCGGEVAKKVSRSTSFALKGDGWAADNYKGKQ